MRTTIGLTALVVIGCSRVSGCSKNAEEKNAQLVAAYLSKEGVHTENLYGLHFETETGDVTIAYVPSGTRTLVL